MSFPSRSARYNVGLLAVRKTAAATGKKVADRGGDSSEKSSFNPIVDVDAG